MITEAAVPRRNLNSSPWAETWPVTRCLGAPLVIFQGSSISKRQVRISQEHAGLTWKIQFHLQRCLRQFVNITILQQNLQFLCSIKILRLRYWQQLTDVSFNVVPTACSILKTDSLASPCLTTMAH
jgi:hypothetical protein